MEEVGIEEVFDFVVSTMIVVYVYMMCTFSQNSLLSEIAGILQ